MTWKNPSGLPVGVGLLIEILHGHYLGLEHPETGLYELPGGAAEPGEHPRWAAFREGVEETGVAYSPLVLLYSGEQINHRGHPYTNYTYRTRLPDGIDWRDLRTEGGKPLKLLVELDLIGQGARFPTLNRAIFAALRAHR